ncbi:MAG: response regulator [Verrucomicrobia bacterium]|jgi:DNA-binding response OmpR family regulator|nr:response regulator [Verrucomicrobiota bacterium]
MSELKKDARIYLAFKNSKDSSQIEDTLVLDGFDVSTFQSAGALWDAFRQRPARIVITERRFGSDLSGLDLARNIRKHFVLPYCFIVILSTMNRIKEIEEGLAAGVDDYLIRPHNPFQLRSRILVGLRWLDYIDRQNPNNQGVSGETAAAL